VPPPQTRAFGDARAEPARGLPRDQEHAAAAALPLPSSTRLLAGGEDGPQRIVLAEGGASSGAVVERVGRIRFGHVVIYSPRRSESRSVSVAELGVRLVCVVKVVRGSLRMRGGFDERSTPRSSEELRRASCRQ
jgi:hypothetical protein